MIQCDRSDQFCVTRLCLVSALLASLSRLYQRRWLVVGLRCSEVGPVGLGLARQETDVRIVAGFGKVIANLELVFLATKLAGNLRGKVIRKGQKNLRAKGLQKRAPGLTGQ